MNMVTLCVGTRMYFNASGVVAARLVNFRRLDFTIRFVSYSMLYP